MATSIVNGWTKLIGTSANDEGWSVGVSPDGSVYLGGLTDGSIDGQ